MAGATFVSNIFFWYHIDYFAKDANNFPLLHLWSLGVEEQYYLVWPLACLSFSGHRRVFGIFIALIAIGSFAVNLASADSHPTAAFYLPTARFWELMLGSGYGYFAASRPKILVPAGVMHALSVIGLGLLVVAVTTIDSHQAYPGWRALVPTLGALFLIVAGPNGLVNSAVLTNRALVFVGLISYPLYLWHWPLLVVWRSAHGGVLSATTTIALCSIATILSILTYAFIERPLRVAKSFGRVNSWRKPRRGNARYRSSRLSEC